MTVPRALTIAGSDSGGGAGIQADLHTFFTHGCFGMSALTALTAQNTVGVHAVHEVPPDFVVEQIAAVAQDIGVDAAKTGMLASAPIVEAVAAAVVEHSITPLVVDPVFVAKGGDRLLAEDAVGSLRARLLPLAALVTPNLPEAEALTGAAISSPDDMEEAARMLYDQGPGAVLVKGGHLSGPRAIDVFYDGTETIVLEGPRHATTDTHGTGCVLSAAITAGLARGEGLPGAVEAGKVFVERAIAAGLRLGSGHGPANPGWASASG